MLFDEMFTLYLKKRETCAFLSHLIYNFTVYIVNNTASPYVEYSIKHFYFNHLVGILEKKNMCFPLAMFCVLDHREEFTVRVGTREGQIEKWMYHTLWETYGTYYLNVRESTFLIFLLSKVIWFCIFFFSFFFLTFCIIVHMAQRKKKSKSISYFVTRCTKWWILVAVEMIS